MVGGSEVGVGAEWGKTKNFKSTVLQLHEGLIFILALKKGTVSPQLLPGV